MKDKIFLIWSGNNDVALKIKNILEQEHNYICYVGGNDDNNSNRFSVGDTVISQMKTCNQAIVLFQKRSDGRVSNNLFFELGYVSAGYGMRKVHCVRRKHDEIDLPSDFDNSFVQALPDENDDAYAQNVVNYFLKRQKLSVDTNKMYLINNRHVIREMLQVHYSETGSRCSDYELAQYVLFYMQAAVMFQDDQKILDELREFKRQHFNEFSDELNESMNLSIALLEVQVGLENVDDQVFLSDDVFRKYYNSCKDMLEVIKEDDTGLFDEWAHVIASENLAYACSLYATNPNLSEDMRNSLYQRAIYFGKLCVDKISDFETLPSIVENNDDKGLLSVFKSYVFRHLFVSCSKFDRKEAGEWLCRSIVERRALLKNFDQNSVDSKIYANFEMEYYLNLVEYLEFFDKSEIDAFDYQMYLQDIDSFISKYDSAHSTHAFVKKILNQRKKLS